MLEVPKNIRDFLGTKRYGKVDNIKLSRTSLHKLFKLTIDTFKRKHHIYPTLQEMESTLQLMSL